MIRDLTPSSQPFLNELSGLESFLHLAAPVIEDGRIHLHQKVQSLAQTETHLPFDPATIVETMTPLLPGWLLTIISRTLVLEMHVTRLRQGLDGESPEARFHSFIDRLKQPETADSILTEYPVLAQQIETCVEQWVDFSHTFLQQLCRDWPAILATFQPDTTPERLVALDSGGDRHRNGRTLLIARFNSGFRLVYKPLSLAVDEHFQQLLHWLNAQGAAPPFRPLTVLNREAHGWMEFVQAAPCQTQQQVERFYRRQGGLLALLYLLEATDFHCENLIAAGEHPVPLDLEALFHPRFASELPDAAAYTASQAMGESVLRVGLLPERVSAGMQSEGIDDSALSGGNEQLTPYPVPLWQNIGRDDMRLVRQRVPSAPAQNLTTLNGTAVSPVDYAGQLLEGFTNIYQLLQQNKQQLLAAGGPLQRFAHDEIRVIFRPTASYMTLLYESYHPNLLRHAQDRDEHLNHLWRAAKHDPDLEKLIPSERADLAQGDIPLFTTTPGGSRVRNSRGQPVPGVALTPSLERVQQRLQQFSQEDCLRQRWFIRASLATLATSDDPKHLPAYQLMPPQQPATVDAFLTAARQVGDRLAELALRGKKDAIWLGLTPANGPHWDLSPQALDLYDGLPGTILFLAYLGQICQDKTYSALAKAAYQNLRQQMFDAYDYQSDIGAFTGWGGLLYLLSHLSTLWQQPALLAEVDTILQRLPPLIDADTTLDIVGGAAGCLAGLFSLYHCRPSETVLTLARQCGERLLATAVPAQQGLGWVFEETGIMPLCGFSHGAAGMAAMLHRLTAVTDDPKFADTAHQAIAYERAVFSAQRGNWPDFRGCHAPDEVPTWAAFMSTWCHGAPGVGLGRLLIWPFEQDEMVHQEIETAVQTTLREGFGFNHCLCHGDLGNLELVTLAAETFGRADWQQQRDDLAGAVLHSIQQSGWQYGTPLGVESPGLMTGIAGIGYGLLRLARPQATPSVLTLEPPKTS